MKKLLSVSIVAFFACIQSVYSQITTNELPISIQRGIGVLAKNKDKGTIDLPVPDIKKILREDSLRELKEQNTCMRIAVSIPVTIDSNKDGIWTVLEDGGKLWQMEIHADKAKAIDFVFSKFWLPNGGKFFIFNPATNESLGAVTSQYLSGEKSSPGRFSTSIIKGDDMVLEYYQPAEEKELPVIIVEKAFYSYKAIPTLNERSSCEVNINCSEGNNWQSEKDAVALVFGKFVQDEICFTGSLVNNVQNNFIPYFLTADHNLKLDLSNNGGYYEIKDAVYDPNLSDWVFSWGNETDCSGPPVSLTLSSTTGATVKANNTYADFALLQLQQDPINLPKYFPFYLGWDASGYSGTGGVCIHHPNGGYKKISTYSCTPTTEYYISSSPAFWAVSWIATTNGHGITETSSSGSPLINNSHRVIGQLSGSHGTLNCSDFSGTSNYGKLCVSWTGNGSVDYRRRLDYWLDPNGTNTQVINGLYPYSLSGPSVICGSSTIMNSINRDPIIYNIIWSIDNSDFSISPSGNQCYVTYTGSQGYGVANLTASVYFLSCLVKQFTKTIKKLSTPDLGDLVTYNYYGEGNWIEGNAGNIVAVENGSNPNYNQYECNIYRINNLFQEELVQHSFASSPSFEYSTAIEGLYTVYIRGINDCGYSDWSSIEVETEAPSDGIDTQCLISYNPEGNSLTVRWNEEVLLQSSPATQKNALRSTYEVQVWNKTKIVKSVFSNQQETTVSLAGFPKDFYIAKVIRDGKNYTKKFIIKK